MNYFISVNRTELKDLIDELNVVYEASKGFELDEEFNKNIKYKFYNDKPLEMTVDFGKN